MSVYNCDGCKEPIPPQKARIHCTICANLDLCANCFVIGAVVDSHATYHPTTLLKKSGLVDSLPPPTLPPRRKSVAPPSSHPAPPPTPPENRPAYSPQPQRSDYPAPNAGYTAFPTSGSAPPPTADAPPSNGPPPGNPPRKSQWVPLYDGNVPTATFVALVDAIFAHLDRFRTGYLSPEVYSNFLDVQGYKLENDVWKINLKPTFGQTREDIADYEFKTMLDNFSIDHIMKPRNQPPNNDMSNLTSSFSGLLGNNPAMANIFRSAQPASVSGGQMPMISRGGFLDITALEVLYDPSVGWGNLNRALQAYGIWRERGQIPRDMLPQFPPQSVLDQVKRVQELSKVRAREKLDALKVQHALAAQGRQNAIELVDDSRYRYRY